MIAHAKRSICALQPDDLTGPDGWRQHRQFRSCEEIALHQIDPERTEHLKFTFGFDAFTDRFDAQIVEHRETVANDRLLNGAFIDATDQLHVQLYKIRLKFR